MHTSLKWDQRFLSMAQLVATWSKDPSTKVAAVIADTNNRVVSVGYNGSPRGVEDATNRDQKLLRTLHAEANALSFALRDVEGFTLYVTHPPCAHCAANIIQRGIARVVHLEPEENFVLRWGGSNKEADAMFAEAGVIIDKIRI